MSSKKLSNKTAKELLWRAGDLSYLLHTAQKDMYDKFSSTDGKRFVICTSRQLGKSYFLCVMAIEAALRTPGAQIKYVAPTRAMVRSIVLPHFREITRDAPEDVKPFWSAQAYQYVFPNGSTISIAGTDSGNVERLRGTKADLCVVDEAAFIADLKYCVADVLLPMTLTTGGRVIIASTPPKVPRHQFEEYWANAQLTGNFCHKTIYDNPFVTRKALQDYIYESGGENTPTWKREYLAQFAFDTNLLVIPEFTKEVQAKIIREVERPPYFDAYVALDPGYTDLTAAVLGYYDFRELRIVIEDEIVMDRIRTDLLAIAIKEKEIKHWGDKKPYFRICDAEPILIRDLSELHGLSFITTDRDDKKAAINEVRLLIQSGQIIIHPRCTNLIAHLASASWDSNREKFTRVQGFGHFDLIDALVYFVRNIRKHHNPYPGERYNDFNMHVNHQPSNKSGSARLLETIFKPRKFS